MVETQQLLWVPALNNWQSQLISTLSSAAILNQSLYVSKTGSDDTGNGSFGSPFLTIAYALSVVHNANTDNRYAIYVAPGAYYESWQIKPWTAVIGVAGSNGSSPNGASLVEVISPTNTIGFSSEWSDSGYAVGWMIGLGFQNHQIWDQNAHSGIQPQLNFSGCVFDAGASFLGSGTVGFDNITWDDCLSYGDVTVRGWGYLWTRNCSFLGGSVTIEAPPPGATEDTKWLGQNSSVGSSTIHTNVLLSAQDGYSSHRALVDLSNVSIAGNLILDGYNTLYSSTLEGVPCSVILLNGASKPELVSCANGLGYVPSVDGYWGVLPTSVAEALDDLAARSEQQPSNSSGSNYAHFFALMPGDNSATVAVGAAVQFPQTGPTSGSVVRTSASTFNLSAVGTYEVTWQVSIAEPGQLQLAIGGVGLPHTVVGRATGTSQLFGNSFITTSVANSILSVINPVGNSTALTITPVAGGASPVSATLSIKMM